MHRPLPGLQRAGLSLIEILFALGILTIVLMGVAATISSAQIAQANAKERLAASMAASAMLEEISDVAKKSGFDAILTYHQSGFAVHYGPGEIGYVRQGTAASVAMKPASPAKYPTSRASAPAKTPPVDSLPGYVEVVDVDDSAGVPRPGIKEVRVTVGWKTTAGKGSDDSVVMITRIAQ